MPETGNTFQVHHTKDWKYLSATHKRDWKQYSALKKNYGTHVIKLDIAPVAFPLGQHLFISASNNMFYRHSQ
jgi:hypothetical protein